MLAPHKFLKLDRFIIIHYFSSGLKWSSFPKIEIKSTLNYYYYKIDTSGLYYEHILMSISDDRK
jgi:hypothetical protein